MEVLLTLHERFFLRGEEADRSLLSSFWVNYYDKIKAELDGQGNLKSFICRGYGDYHESPSHYTLKRKLAHQIGNFLLLMTQENRAKIAKLLPQSLDLAKKMGLPYTFDLFKNTCALALLLKYMEPSLKKKRLHFLFIGDGFGFLAGLTKTVFPNSLCVLVDFGKSLFFQGVNCQKSHPTLIHRVFEPEVSLENLDFIYCPAHEIENLKVKFDIAMSVVAFHEMTLAAVENYFYFLRSHLRRKNLFYLSSRETKTWPDGYVSEFGKFPWEKKDIHLVDEYCPFMEFLFSSKLFQTDRIGFQPYRVKKTPIPFVLSFGSQGQGKVRHRLTRLNLHS